LKLPNATQNSFNTGGSLPPANLKINDSLSEYNAPVKDLNPLLKYQ
jgi:hypothetical protein